MYLFLEREEGREEEREKNINVVASHMPPIEDLTHNRGMCPDWGLNHRPFGSQAHTQSTEPHQPRLFFKFINSPITVDSQYYFILVSGIQHSG